MGKLHYIRQDFGIITAPGKTVFFKKGYVHNVPDEIANDPYFKANEDTSREAIIESTDEANLSEEEVEAELKAEADAEAAAAAQPPTEPPAGREPPGSIMAKRIAERAKAKADADAAAKTKAEADAEAAAASTENKGASE